MKQQSTGPTEDSQRDKCASCGRTIGEYEGAYTTEEGLICNECGANVTEDKTLSDEQDDSETIAKPSMEMYLNPVSSTNWNLLAGSCVISWVCLILQIFLPNNVALNGITPLVRIVAAIASLVLLFRFWEALQVVNLLTTPFLAIVLLFIPLFNVFWIFRVFWGWTLSYNKIISKFHLKISPMSEVLGFLASSAPIILGIVLYKAPQSMHRDDALFLVLICLIFFDIVYILFYRKALVATNSLIEQIEFKES